MSRKKFLCLDCGVDTSKIGEYYVLKESIWRLIHNSPIGMLCIGCAEKRLKRKLIPEDFSNCYINSPAYIERSERLSRRLGLFK